MAIGATTELGNIPWYNEECSAILATTYSSGQLYTGEKSIVRHMFIYLLKHELNGLLKYI